MVPRKPRRFMEAGVGWNYIAMDQAIRDAGLEAGDVVNERTGIIMGSGGPSTRAIVRAADTTREKEPKKVGPFEVPKGMCSGPSAALATGVPDQGHQLFDLVGLRDLGPLHRQRRRADPVGQTGCDVCRRLRGARLDAVGAVRRHGRHVDQVQRHAGQASRAYDKNRDGFVIAGGAGVVVLEELEHAKARGAKIYARDRRLRRDLGRLRHGRPVRRGRRALHAHGHEGIDGKGVGKVDYINPHGTATPVGDTRRSRRSARSSAKDMPADLRDQVAHGPFAGCHRRAGNIFSLLMMNNGFICESANIDELDPEFDDVPIVRSARRCRA